MSALPTLVHVPDDRLNVQEDDQVPAPTPHWHDETATLYAADPRHILADLPDRSADCIVTSPPPWTSAKTTAGEEPRRRYGEEPTAALYIASLRQAFAQAHRVLSDQGTAWLITGDRYAERTAFAGPPTGRHRPRTLDPAMTGLPIASLIGLPWQLAFALHDDGWIIRNVIVWHHPAPDQNLDDHRLAPSYELIFFLVKSSQYYFDGTAVHRSSDDLGLDVGYYNRINMLRCGQRRLWWHPGRGSGESGRTIRRCRWLPGSAATPPERGTAREVFRPTIAGDVWRLPARAQRQSLPLDVPLRCIAAGCRPGGTVLDMFAATGTTGIAARQLDRPFIGIEPNPELRRIAEQRLRDCSRPAGGESR
jgi:hypothetical protein